MPRRRRKPYKPDPFERAFRGFYSSMTEMGWLVLVGAVSLAFALVGLGFLSMALEEAEDTAWEKFGQASTPEEMEEVARGYARHVGPHACLSLGNMLFGEAQKAAGADERRALFARARDAFSRGARTFPRHFLAAYLLEGEGLCLEELGEYSEAVEIFQRACDVDPKGHLAAKLEADIGRNHVLMGDEQGAIHYLDRAVYSGVELAPGIEADWLLNARLLLARLRSKEIEVLPEEAARPKAAEGEREAGAPAGRPEAEEPVPEGAPAGKEGAGREAPPHAGGKGQE